MPLKILPTCALSMAWQSFRTCDMRASRNFNGLLLIANNLHISQRVMILDLLILLTIGKQKLHLDTVGEAVWLRFSDDDQILYTPRGRIDIASFSSDGAKPTTDRSSVVEDGWVIHGSQKVFQFPVGDKVRFSPVIEDTLIVGYEPGRVDLLEFNGSS